MPLPALVTDWCIHDEKCCGV